MQQRPRAWVKSVLWCVSKARELSLVLVLYVRLSSVVGDGYSVR